MKTIIAVMLWGLFLTVLLIQWRSYHAAAVQPARASQIYIHGTPVCVFEERGSIVARIGECEAAGEAEEAPGDGRPFHGFGGGRGLILPPGHPPVGEGVLPGKPPVRTPI